MIASRTVLYLVLVTPFRRVSTHSVLDRPRQDARIPKLAAPDPLALAQAAHLVRRTSVGVHPERIARLGSRSWDDAISEVLTEARERSNNLQPVPEFEEYDGAVVWWVKQLLDKENGLLDRMSWFWHTVLTTSGEKAEPKLLGPQINLFRSKGIGNFRDLLQSFVIDGALLQYLDGAGSEAFNPNENLGRELMELFTLGRGHYSQDDVRVAARALAGWDVDENLKVIFRPESSFNAPALFRGVQADWTTELIVDALCDDPLTAINISNKLWDHLVGTTRDQSEVDKLGLWWHEQDLEILPLVERILRSDEFAEAHYSRPKSGFEWWASMITATGREWEDLWPLQYLGQMPYLPPNVGGWPGGDRWLGPGSLLSRLSVAFGLDSIGSGPWPTEAVLEQCGLYDISTNSVAVLDGVGQNYDLEAQDRRILRWRVALTCPEFNQL